MEIQIMVETGDEAKILDAATDRFMDAGLYKVTMDEIASDLHMSKKTVYKFFPSKEILLKAIVHSMMNRVESTVQEIISSDKPIEEKLTELIAFVGTMMRKFSRPFMTDMYRFAPSLWKEIEIFRREKVLSKLQQMFRQAKNEGTFREDLDPDLFYLVFSTAIQGIMNPQVLSQHSFSAEEAFRGIFKILYGGALTEKARKNFQSINISLTFLNH
jgi:AcrR family transcriptional regulator